MIFETVLLGWSATLLMSKIISQKWTASVFSSTCFHQTFTKYVSNQYTHFDVLTCQMWLQVMKCSLILLSFFGYFHTLLTNIHVWIVASLPNFQRLRYTFLVSQHAKCDYRLWKVLLFIYKRTFQTLLHVWNVIRAKIIHAYNTFFTMSTCSIKFCQYCQH